MPFKTCGQCKKQVGPRTQTCGCGFSFSGKISEKEKNNQTKSESQASTSVKNTEPITKKLSVFHKIATPAGKCPVIPQGYKKDWPDGPADDRAIINWVEEVYQLQNGRMTIEAVIYYARQFWSIHSEEYKQRVLGLIYKTLDLRSSQEPVES